MAVKPSGQCEYCGHIRYTNDLFNGECVPCAEWAQEQINALRAEVARLQAEGMKALQAAAETGELAMNLTARLDEVTNAKTALENVACLENIWFSVEGGGAHRAVCPDRLGDLYRRMRRAEAELEKYTQPLTDEQMRAASAQWETMIDDGTDYGNVRDWDAAIREVRGK